jgi:hypothetical protein
MRRLVLWFSILLLVPLGCRRTDASSAPAASQPPVSAASQPASQPAPRPSRTVSTADALWASGGARIESVESIPDGARVSLLIDNRGADAVLVAPLEIVVHGEHGVAPSDLGGQYEVVAPAQGSARVRLTVFLAPDQIRSVRLFGRELPRIP